MYNRIKKLLITGVIIIMSVGLTGCTKAAENMEDGGGSAVEAEDLPTAERPEEGENETAKEPEGGESEAPEEPDGKEAPGAQDGWAEPDAIGDKQKGADASSLHYIPDTDGDLYGDIYEVGDMQFTVTEIYMETMESGGEIMASAASETEGEAPKITVVYDENTTFEKQKIWDGGAGHEEKEGSASDLQKGFTAEMWGSYEGDVFHATAIKIVEVILE